MTLQRLEALGLDVRASTRSGYRDPNGRLSLQLSDDDAQRLTVIEVLDPLYVHVDHGIHVGMGAREFANVAGPVVDHGPLESRVCVARPHRKALFCFATTGKRDRWDAIKKGDTPLTSIRVSVKPFRNMFYGPGQGPQ
jgi:hypothetical protein